MCRQCAWMCVFECTMNRHRKFQSGEYVAVSNRKDRLKVCACKKPKKTRYTNIDNREMPSNSHIVFVCKCIFSGLLPLAHRSQAHNRIHTCSHVTRRIERREREEKKHEEKSKQQQHIGRIITQSYRRIHSAIVDMKCILLRSSLISSLQFCFNKIGFIVVFLLHRPRDPRNSWFGLAKTTLSILLYPSLSLSLPVCVNVMHFFS